jgi:RHS repeat-associated protein
MRSLLTFLRLPALLASALLSLPSGYSAAATTTLNPIADAYVLDGTWANSNFGSANPIFTQTRDTTGQNYDSYLKFDTTSAGGAGSVASAKLRVSASKSGPGVGMTAYAVADTTWSETGITWNNKPARGAALASVTVAGVSYVFYEFDVSAYVIAEKAAGRNLISFALHNPANSSQAIYIQSRETASGNAPQLVLTLSPPKPIALAPDPLTITAGASGTLTATLSPTPPEAGTLDVASSNTAVATVPASVSFASGQTSVPIPVTALAVGSTIVTASANGGSASATVNVTPVPPTVTSLAPAALSLTQGASGTLTVTISAAQAAATAVALASGDSGVAFVDASVTIPAGAVNAPVPVAAVSPGTAQVTASLNGSSASSQVTVTAAPPSVVSLVPVLARIAVGGNTSLILTLSSAQPADTVVSLAASPAGIVTVPASVTVPAGQTATAVPVAGLALGQAGITATFGASSASAVVGVVPPPAQLVAVEPPTHAMTVGATSSFTVRINAAQPANTEIALSVDNPSLLQLPASVTVAQGATSATFTATALATGGAVITAALDDIQRTAAVQVAQQAAAIVSLVPSPLPLQQGAVGALTVTINAAQAADTVIALANSAPGIVQVPAIVTVAAGTTAATVTVTALATGAAQVTASVNSTTATAAIEVAAPLPVVTAITPATLTLPKGTPGVLRVSVSRAPNVATAVTLASSNPSFASVPATVNIAAGALFADFPVAANSPGQATITASLNGGAASAAVTITPEELAALTLSPAPASAYIGESLQFTATGTMTDGTSQDFTTRVTWTSSNTAVATIASTGVASALAQGQTTITASFGYTAAESGQPVTIRAATTLTVKQQVALVLSAPTLTLQVGQSTIVTVTSSDPAPGGGLVVTLVQSSGTGLASFPPAVTIPAGGTSTTFTLTGATTGNVTVAATAANRLPGSITFTITPQLAITAISPTSGPVGTLVTLTGTGFDPVPGNNQLAFRGINNTTVPAAALTATATVITVKVPPLAETGAITLTNSRGTAQSPTFTVTREQDFQLVVSPASLTVFQGASSTAQAQLASTGTRQFTGLVTLSVQGLPAGVTVSFSPAATLSAFQTGAITFGASGTAVPGSYQLTVQANFTEGGTPFVRSAGLSLTVGAAGNVTGVKGRFVTPENQGIAGIIVRADITANPQPQTTTDAAGNFTLVGLPAGAVTLRFDATPANPLYPIWPYTTTLITNQIAVLADWTINPPPSDDKFVPINNATQTQVITDARFPGLEIRLPAGVTITGWDGVPKTRIAVERIMPDKLPVTAPPVPIREAYQLYFGTPMGGVPSAPIPVTLPNVAELEPGEQTEIWFFDGSPMGGSGEWKLAGLGTVSADGKTVASNAGVGIPRFCGVCGLLSLSCPPPNKPPQPPPGGCPTCGKPIDLFTGQELMGMDLMRLSGLTPIDLSMKYHPVDAYNNRAGTVGSIGFGWVLSYDVGFLPFSGPQKRLVLPGSRFVNFVDDGAGNYKPFDDPGFDGAVITATNATANEWQLKFKDGRIWRFKPFPGISGFIRGGPPTFVTEMIDASGNVLSIARQSNGRITSIGLSGRNVVMTYGANGFVSEMRDSAERVTRFTYNANNRIETLTDPDGKVTRFTYVDDNEVPAAAACSTALDTGGQRLKTILYPGRTTVTENFHGASRRILRQLGHDGREHRVAYKVTGACVTHVSNPGVKCTANCPDTDSWENFQAGWRIHGGKVIGVTVTDPNGSAYGYSFTARGLTPGYTSAEGQATSGKYDSANRLTERTDALGRTWKYKYDDRGNVIQEVDPLGRITDYTYDAKWNKPTSITRLLADVTSVIQRFTYDLNTGNLLTATDPLGNVTSYGYTARGELNAVTVPGNRTTSLEYNAAGDRIGITDPLGNATAFATDGVGRTVTLTDPLGFSTRTDYNGIDQVTRIIDARGQETNYTYDLAQRLASVIDPRNNAVESYQYDAGDRVIARIDALNKAAGYLYDIAGRLAQITDRKGQVTGYEYDPENRVTRISYPEGAHTRSYDSVGRLTEIREAASSIAYAYDNANRLIRETTDSSAGRHEVAYEYDTLDRVVRRTVNGVDPTVYAYDNASRLASITYRGQTTSYEWDVASRLTAKTLPNGIRQEFAHDDADRLLSITYKKPDTGIIEAIAYTYDAKGQRLTKTTGTSGVPETAFTASYDAANRLTSLTLAATGQTFALIYDDNGNLASKTETANPSNVTIYTWDTRNRLSAITAPGVAASFKYDALGRRIEKTVNGQSIGYVYDGMQAIGEVVGGSINATLLTGLMLDEVIARYSQTGNRTYLTDALNSVIAQSKDDQAIQNFYAYSPYGEVIYLGSDEGNPIQYTARENDQTGLYYYRARYYDPVLKRFISEDPIGLRGGLNRFAYVGGNPVSLSDPSGEIGVLAAAVVIVTAIAVYEVGSATINFLGNLYICSVKKDILDIAEEALRRCRERQKRGVNCNCDQELRFVENAQRDYLSCIPGAVGAGGGISGGLLGHSPHLSGPK